MLLKRGVHQRKVIGRNVRIREASIRVSDLTDLDRVFEALEATFAQDEFECAEVRLRRSFVGAGPSARTRTDGSTTTCRCGRGIDRTSRSRRAGRFDCRSSRRRVSALGRSCCGRMGAAMT